ncbi:MAG: alpha/beta hydrolase [Gallionella sp.]|nr:alpha/beta hydrolase [Gallionella sp.]
MKKTIIQGRFSHKLRSMAISGGIAVKVLIRRALGRGIVAEWPFLVEYGTLYIRAQFNHAFHLSNDITASRAYFDSVYALIETYPDVEIQSTGAGEPRGHWFVPQVRHSDATLLHFHGGGYTFYAGVSHHFAACLAHTLGITVFAPDYRLTPEHPHPAQLEDGLAAYNYLLERGIDPAKIVLCGDSAGGHLALMTLARLRQAGLPKPVLTLCLSPWTDIGRRGKSQFGNDPYDLVQGYMTLQFADWLKGGQTLSDAELSPIYQDFHDLGPIYLQAGGKEILVDMIRDFAATVAAQSGRVRLDVWTHMNHEFHAYGDYLPESHDALARLREAIAWALGQPNQFGADARTECDCIGE